MLIVIHFSPSRSFLYRDFASGIVKNMRWTKTQNANKLLTKMLEIVLTPKFWGPPKSEALD